MTKKQLPEVTGEGTEADRPCGESVLGGGQRCGVSSPFLWPAVWDSCGSFGIWHLAGEGTGGKSQSLSG